MTTPPSRRRYFLYLALLLCAVAALYLYNPERRAAVHLERGKLYLKQARPAQARAEFARSIELDPPAWEAQYLAGEALVAAGEGAEAITLWSTLRSSPVAARALAAAAEQARVDGDPDQAMRLCADARADGLPLTNFLAVEGRVLHDAGDTAQAYARFREAVQAEPSRLDLTLEFAGLLLQGNALAEAETVLQAALERDPQSAGVLIQLAEMEKRRARPDEALAYYRRAVAADPTISAAQVALMQLLADVGQWEEAEARARELESLPAAAPLAQFVLGQAAHRRREYGSAVEYLKLARIALPNDAMVALWLGRAHLKHGEPEEGLSALQAAVGRAPRNVALRMELLRTLWEYGRFAEAQDVAAHFTAPPTDPADRAFVAKVQAPDEVDLGKMNTDALLRYSNEALQQGNGEAARRAGILAHRQAPQDPRPLVALGLTAMAAQDTRAALGYFEEARRRAPGDAAAAINRARMLRGLGQLHLAVTTLQRALDAEDADVDALLPELCGLLLIQGEADEVEALIRTHAQEPLNATLAVLRGQAMLRRQRPAEARTAVAGLQGRGADLCRLRAALATRDEQAARTALDALGTLGPELLGLTDVVTHEANGAVIRGTIPDHPVARAWALAQGRVALREQVAAELGSLGATLGLVALGAAGDWDSAHAWQAAGWPGTAPLQPEHLPARPRAYMTALVFQMLQWPEVADRFYEDAEPPDHPVLLAPVLECTLALGREDQAQRLAEVATAGAPPLAALWYRRAALTWSRADAASAETVVQAALEAVPESGALLALAGQLAQERERRQEAIALYRRALDAGAGAEVRNSLAWLLAEDEATLAEATALALQAQDLAPFSPAVADTLGWCYYRQNQMGQALFFSNLAVLLNPFDAKLRLHRGQVLLAADRSAAVLEDCAAIRELGPPEFVESAAVRALCAPVAG